MAIEVAVCRGAGVAMPDATAKCGREKRPKPDNIVSKVRTAKKQLADALYSVQHEPVLYAVCTRSQA